MSDKSNQSNTAIIALVGTIGAALITGVVTLLVTNANNQSARELAFAPLTQTAIIRAVNTGDNIETNTQTETSSPTIISTLDVSVTVKSTNTPTLSNPVMTPTPIPTLQSTITESVASPTMAAFLCTGTIPFLSGGMMSSIHILPRENAPPRPPVPRGIEVIILRSTIELAVTWYEIEYEDNAGWVMERDIELDSNCPT